MNKFSLNKGELIYIPIRKGVVNSVLANDLRIPENGIKFPVYAGENEKVCHSLASIIHTSYGLNSKESGEYDILVVATKKDISLKNVSVPTNHYTYQHPVKLFDMIPVDDESKSCYGMTPSGTKFYFDSTPLRTFVMEGISFGSDNFDLVETKHYSNSPLSFGI